MREAGVLLHISSLPGKYGVGTLGECAYKFVDFLKKSGQKIWQILPIGQTVYGDSPYSPISAFAYNPYFIDFDLLLNDGLIKAEDLPNEFKTTRVNYDYLYKTNYPILSKAYLNHKLYLDEFNEFKESNDDWLDDYSLFMVLREIQEYKPWNLWYHDAKYKNIVHINWIKENYKNRLDEYKFYQFLFYKQFKALKDYANKNGILIMGDMPIYCSYDSVDVWANPKDFDLDENLSPKFVAGCPPDMFSSKGQLWGNPLYDWNKMKNDKYKFWVKRVKYSFKLYDILRIDHFRGFAGYYAIPSGDSDATRGHWEVGPGYDLFKEINNNLGDRRIVAENLGFLTKDVFKLLDKCGYPGMVIFQFELGDGMRHSPIKKEFKSNNIFYTGTHDNQTIMSFYNQQNELYKSLIDKVCNISIMDKPNFKIIEFAMNTKCDVVIIPIQDYLGLTDEEGRMNLPSTVSNSNWSYMAREFDFSNDLAKYIKRITKESGR